VKLYGYFSDAEHIYMLIEYMEDGSLYALMKRSKRIEEPEAIEKLSEIC
jgi:serine/threonine protein kinase